MILFNKNFEKKDDEKKDDLKKLKTSLETLVNKKNLIGVNYFF